MLLTASKIKFTRMSSTQLMTTISGVTQGGFKFLYQSLQQNLKFVE